MAGYAMNTNERVSKLTLYAPLWHLKAPPPFSGSGAYRVVARDAARQRGIRGIPPQRVEEISPTAWFDAWWQANLATDPVGAKQDPPVLRAPNGVLKDIVDYWGAGKATWEPEKIRVPTLLILAEWDQDSRSTWRKRSSPSSSTRPTNVMWSSARAPIRSPSRRTVCI